MVTQKYDLSVNALYLKLAEGTFARTREIDEAVNVDLDAAGRLLGIEVLGPGHEEAMFRIVREYGISDSEAAFIAVLWTSSWPQASMA